MVQPSSLECPRCHAPLAPSRFARQVECAYCGATVRVDPSSVDAGRFKRALAEWEDPSALGLGEWVELEGGRWALLAPLAPGEVSDVYLARRARWPTQEVVVKLLRDDAAAARFEREASLLRELAEDPEGPSLGARCPWWVDAGEVKAGPHRGRRALVYRGEPDFRHTFEAVRRAYPAGVDPKVALWMWRRILELLAALHTRGKAHQAILPRHLLVQEGDHGVRVVGFGHAAQVGMDRTAMVEDVRQSARAIAFVLGAPEGSVDLPRSVPAPFAERLHEAAAASRAEAWALREELGRDARRWFGPPGFHPLAMPQ